MIKDITLDNNLKTILDKSAGSRNDDQNKGINFSDALKESIAEVNTLQKEAAQNTDNLIKGDLSVHETMISMEKASLSFKMMMQVRNKIIDAYQEVLKMPV